jgi:threonine dehydrogenase-like Zn-dependent dehydrogenase
MKAVVFHDVGDIRLDDVPEPKLQSDTDAVDCIASRLEMAYRAFDTRQPGWIKVELKVGQGLQRTAA